MLYTFCRNGGELSRDLTAEQVVEMLAETDPGEFITIHRQDSGELVFRGVHIQ